MSSLEDKIKIENPDRFVDAFVKYISLGSIGSRIQTIKRKGKHEKTNLIRNQKNKKGLPHLKL
jgi:hypothetical protein